MGGHRRAAAPHDARGGGTVLPHARARAICPRRRRVGIVKGQGAETPVCPPVPLLAPWL